MKKIAYALTSVRDFGFAQDLLLKTIPQARIVSASVAYSGYGAPSTSILIEYPKSKEKALGKIIDSLTYGGRARK